MKASCTRHQNGLQAIKEAGVPLSSGDQKNETRKCMKVDNGIPTVIDQADIQLHYYPINGTSINGEGGIDRYSYTRLHTRVCPYCESVIPADEDPCHRCGHLEPAEVVPNRDASNSGSIFYYKFVVAFLLISGIAMIISPESNPLPNYECAPFNADDCMLPFLIWSRPGGIFLVILASIFIGYYAIIKSRVKKAHSMSS